MPYRHFALALGLLALAGGISYAPAQARDGVVALSAKKSPAKRHLVRRARPQQQVACTIYGCHPIPAGCTPRQGYNWRGNPTGYDVVVCR